jgi:hypothetical protein
MARVKVTGQNIKSKLQAWAQGNNLTDELVFSPKDPNPIDVSELINLAWANNVIIEELSDTGQFKKLVYKEKLL